ncbi:DUF715-domain-containing protein [Hyphopichia burtonii NRRL Y-1933]|uniref:tRNA:m(4)X modification enzyme TRM13 n=1 Tax=Hyphopichia burtonii NRRL Y-1933 TaxID=984485 RepID=A0A1E4RGM1_9ASCO|nr:DUF715-domain-containing protein [Hyphopichia burtonii NRRL Y-1933]ODV66417.1 DUF715-domain-containing protein [Hyphopichia burtonii NRRL Y-1933]
MPETTIESNKRRKYDKKTQVKPNQCEFFLAKKNRRCSMQRKANQKYCSEHMSNDQDEAKGKRIPCPYDNQHTVWTKDLSVHLKKCNSRPKEEHEPWYEKDININLKGDSTEIDVTEEDKELLEEVLLDKYIPILKKAVSDFLDLKHEPSEHQGLDAKLLGLLKKKHALQHSSLIGNLKDRELLKRDNFYVEFGCGKGELSRSLNQCIMSDIKGGEEEEQTGKYGFGLIDRGVNRLKLDRRIIKDCEEGKFPYAHPIIRRSRIDIKDLKLDNFVLDLEPKKVVGISKHLCGAATDLTLKLIFNSTLLSENLDKFGGLLIAMCCRHACQYQQLLPQSQKYLYEKGFKTEESFKILKKIVSWAVSGFRENEEKSSEGDREDLGLLGRRLIDESRVWAINQILSDKGLIAEMFIYTDKEITLENSCLCIRPK